MILRLENLKSVMFGTMNIEMGEQHSNGLKQHEATFAMKLTLTSERKINTLTCRFCHVHFRQKISLPCTLLLWR